MNFRDVMVALAGGAMVYGAMAACTGGETMSGAHADNGAAGAGACECEPRKPQVDTVTCNGKQIVMEYPGASREELALVSVLSDHLVPPVFEGSIQHYEAIVNIYMFDGRIVIPCIENDTYTFVRP
jgi:hypothetical protein